jgi:hypothetical protein
LRILLQATRHSPRAIRPALFPTPIRHPDRLSTLAAREWQLSIMRVISPRRHSTVAGTGRTDAHRAGHQNQANDHPRSGHGESPVDRHDTATQCILLPSCYSTQLPLAACRYDRS